MKKMIKTILTTACVTVLCTSFPVQAADDRSDFDAFMRNLLIEEAGSDYLSLHFLSRYPQTMGIEKPEPTIGRVSYEDYEESEKNARDVLDELAKFDRDKLTDKQKHDYDALKYSYEFQEEVAAKPDFDWYFTPSNNVIGELSTNLTEFVFYSADDFTDYVSLLKLAPAFFDTAMNFTEEQAFKGYFMSDAALDEVLQDIRDFAGKKDDNPILSDFREELKNTDLLDEGRKQELDAEVTSVVKDELLPQCEETADRLAALRGKGCQTGYHDMKGGPEYYEEVIRNTASTTRDVDTIFNDLEGFLKHKLNALVRAMSPYREEFGTVGMTEPEEILKYLSTSFADHGFPKIEDVNYHVDYLDPTVVSGNVLAYYVGSPIDDYSENSIKVNKANVTDVNTLYESLAHEGYPGHLYQHVYYLGTDPSGIRECLGFLGYTEGWAMYAESQAWNWGVVLPEDAAVMMNQVYVNYAAFALSDLCVNGKGYDEQELTSYFERLGLNPEIAPQLYESALTHPFDYLSYGYGMMRLVSMREQAEYSLGDAFDEEAFHRVLLDNGPRTLDAVEEDVEDWIDESLPNPFTTSAVLWLVTAGACTAAAIIVLVRRKKARKEEWS